MNRNYASHPVQTHLELFTQMAESGHYSSADIEICHRAYHQSLACVYSLCRGSGKPFQTHLVGTASILVSQACRVEMIAAALIHSLYQRRVPVPGAEDLAAKRSLIKREFGAEIEALVFYYTEFEAISWEEFTAGEPERPFFEDILRMHVADELEDVAYFSLFFHGRAGDGEEQRGSERWRQKAKRAQVNKIFAFIGEGRWPELRAAFDYWIGRAVPEGWSEQLKTGQYSSYSIE